MKEIFVDGKIYVEKPEPKLNCVAFILTMPNVGSWNGKWSGESDLHCVVKKYYKDYDKAIDNNYYYNFGDGWGVNIEVVRIDSATSRKYKKQSKGFCGYEWMINSIIDYNEIKYMK